VDRIEARELAGNDPHLIPALELVRRWWSGGQFYQTPGVGPLGRTIVRLRV
jgi:hypothetical protein